MAQDGPPPEVELAARQRAVARAERDFAAADRLRGEIAAAGWRVVDSGPRFRLERASPPSLEVEGEIRYGRSEDVPSRLAEPETGLATVVVASSADHAATRDCLEALAAHAPAGVDIVLVEDGFETDAADVAIEGRELAVVRTSAPLGAAAALNIGIRRTRAPIVVVLDPGVTVSGDAITPLVDALADPTIAVAGDRGVTSTDLQRFDDAPAKGRDVAAVDGSIMAFRRVDAAAAGSLDEAFRRRAYLGIYWSLVLRDASAGPSPRRAVVIPGLPMEVERSDGAAVSRSERDRRARRNFYRLLDRFRGRRDLAVPGDDV